MVTFINVRMGRFISRDPLGYVDGMSLYGAYFAQGFALDPLGNMTFDPGTIGTSGCVENCLATGHSLARCLEYYNGSRPDQWPTIL